MGDQNLSWQSEVDEIKRRIELAQQMGGEANVARQHWMTKPDREDAGLFDASQWEGAKKVGDAAVKRLINGGLDEPR